MPRTLPPPYAMPQAEPRPVIVDLRSGWYLRGDVGAVWGRVDGADAVTPFTDPADNKLGKAMTGSLGVGIKGSWLRTDLTLDYLSPMKYQGSVATAGDTTAKIQATSALFNGYLDLGTWYRATPYIGAGAGAAQVRVTDYSSTAAPPFNGASKNQWKFAWAAMAGVAFPISTNMLVDVGYRYLNFGDVATGSDAFGPMQFKNVAAHEVRVGVRWSFDELRYVR
jgi:opacity protein-like surface antigen